VLGKPLETVDEHGFAAINPRARPRDRVCYDLSMDDLLARLMDYNPRAREQCAIAALTRNNTPFSVRSLPASLPQNLGLYREVANDAR
jgi:16S rRNA U1498 N3-methylase RsmE